MAISIPTHLADSNGTIPPNPSTQALTPTSALRRAWIWYIAMAFVPFFMFCSVLIFLNYHAEPSTPMTFRGGWFVGSICFMLVAGPAAFLARSRLFRPYWHGEPVAPGAYLRGMLFTWWAFEVGGILSLVGCFMTNALLPCLMPAIAAFFFFVTLYPNGRAMVRPTGNTDDPEIYQEPR